MKTQQQGFTLIEVVVAMVILAVLLSMMGGMTFSVARLSLANGAAGQRHAAAADLVNRYYALPVDSLGPRTDTVTIGGNKFERVVEKKTGTSDIKFIIYTNPLAAGVSSATDTVIRAGTATKSNPLCHPSC